MVQAMIREKRAAQEARARKEERRRKSAKSEEEKEKKKPARKPMKSVPSPPRVPVDYFLTHPLQQFHAMVSAGHKQLMKLQKQKKHKKQADDLSDLFFPQTKQK